MANFKTHITVAAVISTTAAIVLAGAGVVSREFSIVLIFLGALGGIIPDIDSDHSTSLKLIFHSLAISLAFVVIFAIIPHSAILIALLAWLGIYAIVFYLIQPIFKQLTVHRGAFHSLPMAVLACCATAAFCLHIIHYSSKQAWLAGLFVGFGCLIHLLLDEMCSVNLANVKVKRSFGTACKLFSRNFIVSFAVLYALLVASVILAPRYDILKEQIFTEQNYQLIEQHLLPNCPQYFNAFYQEEEE